MTRQPEGIRHVNSHDSNTAVATSKPQLDNGKDILTAEMLAEYTALPDSDQGDQVIVLRNWKYMTRIATMIGLASIT